jgi:DNA-binding beta-propeller fold protein YncE
MTYILCSRCKDGIALIADKKIVYEGYQIHFREKLIIVDDSLVVGASGAVSLFDAFRDRIGNIIKDYRRTRDINQLMKKIADTTRNVNREYEYVMHSRDFDLILALKTSDMGVLLKYVYPDGYTENVYTFRVLGVGEPYGLAFLRKLWRPDISMIEAAELGYRVISYIEKFDLNGSVGVGDGRPQILFMTGDGLLKKASESLLDRLNDSCKNWLQRYESSIHETYRPALTVNGYVCRKKWAMSCASESGLTYPEGIDIDSSGNVYVAAQSSRCVEKFDLNGNFISLLRSKGTDDTRFQLPYALAIDSLNNIYVSESDSSCIQKFDKNGKFVLMWGNRGTDEGQFSSPHGLCIDASGNVYVTDETNHRIQKFRSNGEFITKWGSEGQHDNEFSHPLGIATDSKNNVYVADHLNHRIQKFDSNGEFIMRWGTYGTGDGEFNRPHGVTFDTQDNLYVTDSLNHRIQVLSTDGRFITKWGSKGSEDGRMNIPRDLVVDLLGNVYVSDGANHRIQVFTPSWKKLIDLDYFNE